LVLSKSTMIVTSNSKLAGFLVPNLASHNE